MSFTLSGKTISKVGVVGSGQIGPDIALYFSKTLLQHEISIVVFDIAAEALEKGRKKVEKKIQRGVTTGAFKQEFADAMMSNITFSSEINDLSGADFVIEAATENENIKQSIVKQLEEICPQDAIIASNSSHMEPEVIFTKAQHKNRTLVIHYFFPAERNPVVEIVPGASTAEETTRFCMNFYEAIGKVPVHVKSRYGYAIDPIFEGLFLAAALCVEKGLGSPKVIDAISCKALGLGVGPFTAMNLTGGNPITHHGLDILHTKVMPWFRSPELMQTQMNSCEPWEVAAKGEDVVYDDKTFLSVSNEMLGAYFGLVTEILESGIIHLSDLEMSVELGLVIKAPFNLMNKMGVQKAYQLVQAYSDAHKGFPVPACLKEQASSMKPWKIEYIRREDRDHVAILTIKRPRVLNALNREIFMEIKDHFNRLASDDSVQSVVVTGFGVKAFVSGADIGMLASIQSPEDGAELSNESNNALLSIAECGKPVVCAMNGLAFGGGNELAMACTVRIGAKNTKVFVSQPEAKLGIIPGAGATQRLPRIIGMEKAHEWLRTGQVISSAQAKECGLIMEEVEGPIVDRAIEIAKDIVSGKLTVPTISQDPIAIPEHAPEVNIGNLSTAIDSILVRALMEGGAMSLKDGLKQESKYFGECCATKDMKIGLKNFIETSLKKEAEFIHE